MHSDSNPHQGYLSITHLGMRIAAAILLLAGLLWTFLTPASAPPASAPVLTTALVPGSVGSMDSPVFAYSPGWTVTDQGASPPEPADPWQTPAGIVTFQATGQEIALNLARGDYWGYLYVIVDGAPANRLADIPGNVNSEGRAAGYTTLYAPEAQTPEGPAPRWVVVHRNAQPGITQQVRVEIWRAWGQSPLRGVAVDALPAPARPLWPGTLMLVLGGIALVAGRPRLPRPTWVRHLLAQLTRPIARQAVGDGLALFGALLVGVAMLSRIWWLGPPGLALLAYASLTSPLRWAAAVLAALPFYYSATVPILPGRATNLIDVGVWGGLVVSLGYWLGSGRPVRIPSTLPWLVVLAGWALVAATAADYTDLALREWRTVFAAALGLGVLLAAVAGEEHAPRRMRVLLAAWLGGALIMAGIGVAQAVGGFGLIEAEGVLRVRGLYGSPNNLALYLERVLFIPLAGVLLLRSGVWRGILLAVTGLLGAVLLLTFSKGALLVGLPAGLATLWVGGLWLLRRQGRATASLWWLAAAALAILVGLLPSVGTERFQRLLDFETGTGMTRLLLWRSSWQMALDHAWLGVGPDNFLYAYRSGYLLPAAWQEPNLNHPHNLILDWWTRLGLPGLVLGFGWMASGVWGVWQRFTRAVKASAGALWLGLLAGCSAALAHGLIDLSYAVPDLMLVWVLIFALPDLAEQDDAES